MTGLAPGTDLPPVGFIFENVNLQDLNKNARLEGVLHFLLLLFFLKFLDFLV